MPVVVIFGEDVSEGGGQMSGHGRATQRHATRRNATQRSLIRDVVIIARQATTQPTNDHTATPACLSPPLPTPVSSASRPFARLQDVECQRTASLWI